MFRTRIMLVAVSTGTALLAALVPPAPAAAGAPVPDAVHSATATAQRVPASLNRAAGWRFTWNTMTAGDCTMFQGASWTVWDNGYADFDGVVTSSDDDDAWLMWADLKDGNGSVLTRLQTADIQNPADRTRFIKNLPDSRQTYRWFTVGQYNNYFFQFLRRMTLYHSC
ncbi:hypothetical protein Val02_78520 [Virgisporangium aliadipatigenens]|uniref:DUF6294 domain-containing protein n=1 Tax=Virgisporangium aliadipatigenens TaxID=741659 RepID=A0A8J4DV09_9ACTN|nr:DUF6294 family protein [Virgisporangium aliadipatigenens]GIJ50966.1 hypothetical protein Val02_78520 [Virgisporangium aliadipatigenens]